MAERLSFQEAVAQISKFEMATLEGLVSSYAGNALRVVWSENPYTVFQQGTGAEVAELLRRQPVPVALKKRKEVMYAEAGGLDGRVQVTKEASNGLITFSISGDVVDPKDHHRTFYYSYTVLAKR